ncbi:hypothetical protein M1E17_05855 [Arthrobacter sp. D1-29]
MRGHCNVSLWLHRGGSGEKLLADAAALGFWDDGHDLHKERGRFRAKRGKDDADMDSFDLCDED